MVNIDIEQEIDGVRDKIAYAIFGLGRVLRFEEDRYKNLSAELQDGEVGKDLARHIDVVELAIGRLHEVIIGLY